MNTLHSDDEIAAIAHGLIHRTLPKSCWTHAAHFAAALWFLRHHSRDNALNRIRESIRAYNEASGLANTDSSGYHETITQASLRVASHFRCMRKGAPLYAICNDLLASPHSERGSGAGNAVNGRASEPLLQKPARIAASRA